MNLRDRVVRLDRVKANQLQPHPENWRTHPDQQVAALDAILGDIGFAGAVVARELDDGSLQIIDGHERAVSAGTAEVPVLVTDLDETEARMVLATYDPIGAMAESNGEALTALLDELPPVDDEALDDLLADLRTFPHAVPDGEKVGWNPEHDTTTGETASDLVGYDLGSVWMRTGEADTRVFPYLVPLPTKVSRSGQIINNLLPNYSRSPPEEMEWIVRTYMRPGDRFLEVCAGWFTFSATAAMWGYEGVGADIWKTSLDFGRKQRAALPTGVPRFDIETADACQLPYADGEFNFIYCNPPFFQLEPYSDDRRDLSRSESLDVWLTRSGDMMVEMARVARPDALIVTVMADSRKDGELRPLHSRWIEEAQRRGLVLHDIAVQHLRTQELRLWRRAHNNRRTAKAHEYVITFKRAS